jgi:hypothetical protein
MALDDACREPLAHWAHPGVHIHCRAAQAQRGLTAHRHAMLARASVPTAIGDIPHRFRVAAPKHLVHEAILIARIVARMDPRTPLPGIDNNLFEDTPCRQRCCHQQATSLGGRGLVCGRAFYHIPPTKSTPSSACMGSRPLSTTPLQDGDVRAIPKWEFLYDQEVLPIQP